MNEGVGSDTVEPRRCRDDGDGILFLNMVRIETSSIGDSLVQARSVPADLSLEAETVVLQLGGGDDGVGGDHRAVTALTALTCHAPHPLNLQYVLPGANLLTLIPA